MSGFRESYAYLADGRPIYYLEEGEGPPLIYSHGSTGNADVARPMFELLRTRFHCIALDRAGNRRSGPMGQHTTLAQQVEAIAAVHRACTTASAWVFGHSAGAVFAIAYAIAYPAAVDGLVLMEPPVMQAIPANERQPGYTQSIVTSLLRAGRLRDAIFQFMGALYPDRPPTFWAEVADTAVAPENLPAWECFAAEHEVVLEWLPTPAEWRLIAQPALVLEGSETVGWFRELAAKIAELLPQGELATLDGLDHLAPIEAPDVVAQKIVEFVDRHTAA